MSGLFTHVDFADQNVVCGDMGGEFQVRIGERTVGIVETDDGAGRFSRKPMTPQQWGLFRCVHVRRKPDTPHALA